MSTGDARDVADAINVVQEYGGSESLRKATPSQPELVLHKGINRLSFDNVSMLWYGHAGLGGGCRNSSKAAANNRTLRSKTSRCIGLT